jgi:hypothetical protein
MFHLRNQSQDFYETGIGDLDFEFNFDEYASIIAPTLREAQTELRNISQKMAYRSKNYGMI